MNKTIEILERERERETSFKKQENIRSIKKYFNFNMDGNVVKHSHLFCM